MSNLSSYAEFAGAGGDPLLSLSSSGAPPATIEEVLTHAGLSQYLEAFRKYTVQTARDVLDMEESDFVELAVKPFHRKKIIRAASELARDGDQPLATPAVKPKPAPTPEEHTMRQIEPAALADFDRAHSGDPFDVNDPFGSSSVHFDWEPSTEDALSNFSRIEREQEAEARLFKSMREASGDDMVDHVGLGKVQEQRAARQAKWDADKRQTAAQTSLTPQKQHHQPPVLEKDDLLQMAIRERDEQERRDRQRREEEERVAEIERQEARERAEEERRRRAAEKERQRLAAAEAEREEQLRLEQERKQQEEERRHLQEEQRYLREQKKAEKARRAREQQEKARLEKQRLANQNQPKKKKKPKPPTNLCSLWKKYGACSFIDAKGKDECKFSHDPVWRGAFAANVPEPEMRAITHKHK